MLLLRGGVVKALHLAGALEQLRRRQRFIDLELAAEVEPFGDLAHVGVREPSVVDDRDGAADQFASDVVGPLQLPLVFQLELSGDGGNRCVDIGHARTATCSRVASARRSAFEMTFSSSEIGRRWLTPERLSIFWSWRAGKATPRRSRD